MQCTSILFSTPPIYPKKYQSKGRIQIKDLLSSTAAMRIRQALLQTPWSITFNERGLVHRLSREEQARLPRHHIFELMSAIGQRATTDLQFLYEYDPIFVRYFARDHPWMPIFEAFEFLNSPSMMAFLRKVTDLSSICWADAQATSYSAGHFLKTHDDLKAEEHRLAAYVINLTPDWPADYGGLLQFFDRNGDVEQGYRPRINALNLFTVPALHRVGMVAMFAPERRLSITGWLRGDQPPGAFGRYPQSLRV